MLQFIILARNHRTQDFWKDHSWQKLLNPLFYEDLILPIPPFSNFVQLLLLLFLLHRFFIWMGDCATSDVLFYLMQYGSSHAEPWCLSTTRTLRCVLCNKTSVYWNLPHDVFFASVLIWYHTHTKTPTVHIGAYRLTHPHKYILTPPVMCSQQLSALYHRMNNSLISKMYYTEFQNIFPFQKLLTCRNHVSIDKIQ